ncbi:hypothetical protein RvY_16766-2 [Ramazzottius varieornatus]|uniref:Lipoprotein n=1 Tax=Ramazzottius varieornatus TaxID=947166 RepID=A0A1D1W0S2_RAMVA|nr:hypothetical protein RvY_16766-2 [Ramazzottius varieornatus]
MAFRVFVLVCLAFATGCAYQNVNNGASIITFPGDVRSGALDNREFQNQFKHGILDRLLRGKKMKVSVEETRRLTYEQDEECNDCNQPTQSIVTERPLPPGPILIRYGGSTIFVPCSAQSTQILYTGLSATSPLPITWHGKLQSSSDVSDVSQAIVFVVGPDSNGNYAPAVTQPLGTVYQTYEIWVTDSLGRRSTSVFVTVSLVTFLS